MLKINERDILFMDIKIESWSKEIVGLPALPAEALIYQIENFFKLDKAKKITKNGKETLYISDICIDKNLNHACILINISDANAVDPAFSAPLSNSRRVVPKNSEINEGQDTSCHVLWSLNDLPGKPNSQLLLMELVPGMSSSKVQSFLNFLLRKCCANSPDIFKVDHPDGSSDSKGNVTKVKFRPRIKLSGHISDQFLQDLEAGRLLGIDLINEEQQGVSWDSTGTVRENKRVVQVLPSGNGVIARKLALLDDIFGRAKTQYGSALVRFRTEYAMNRSVRLYTDTMTLASDAMYIKKAKIKDFQISLAASYERICKHIHDKMVSLI